MSEMKKDEIAEDQAQIGDDAVETDVMSDELEALRAERDELRDRFMRALADAENIRKRGERDRREAEQYGGSKLARDLLPVYDNLKRALDSATADQREAAKALIEGVELTMRELVAVLGRHGVQTVAPSSSRRYAAVGSPSTSWSRTMRSSTISSSRPASPRIAKNH